MKLDIDKTFGDIYGSPGPAFRQDILELRQHTLLRDNLHRWANNLRFITVPKEFAEEEDSKEEREEGGEEAREEGGEVVEEVGREEGSKEVEEEGRENCNEVEEISASDDISEADTCSENTSDLPCACDGRLSFERLQPGGTGYFRVTDPGEIPDCIHYVAVSYCWRRPRRSSGIMHLIVNRLFVPLLYTILSFTSYLLFWLFGQKMQQVFLEQPYVVRTTSGFRHSQAPREILDRAMKYAAIEGVRLIWIDQECIEQTDRSDKEFGIQSMDLVYQRASHPVGLMNAYIKTQAHMDALLKIVLGEPFTTEEYESAVEVLELLAEDRWLSRAWIYQEVAAAGDTMELLIRCDPGLDKSIYLGRIPGEVTVSIEIFIMGVGWINAWTGFYADDQPEALKMRAQSAIEWLIKISPAWIGGERDPESRYGCNGLQALKLLGKRQNSRIPDRIAILANLCNYPIRINTEKVASDTYSFSTCAFALALFNGDISFMIGFAHAYGASEETSAVDDINTTRNHKTFSWTPPSSISFERLEHFEELTNTYIHCLIDSQVLDEGFLVSGWLWQIDTRVYLPRVQEQYSSLWSSLANRNRYESGPGSASRVTQQIFWSIIREMVEIGYVNLAEAVWHSIRCPTSADLKDPRRWGPAPELPTSVTEVIDPQTHQFILHQPPFVNTESDAYRFFSANLHPGKGQEFIIERVFRDGFLWCGKTGAHDQWAIFDVSDSSVVLSPKCKGIDISPRTSFRKEAISWRIKQGGRRSDSVEILEACGMVKGLWKIEDVPAERFIIS